MNRTTTITAAVAATGAFIAARFAPAVETARIHAAVEALTAHTAVALRALRWEGARILQSLELGAIDPAALSTVLTGAAAVLVATLAWRARPAAARALSAAGFGTRATIASRAANTGRTRRSRTARRPSPRVARARTLAAQDRLAIDVARETSLSRDAVELIMRIPPDGIAGNGRTFRPSPTRHPVGQHSA